ncbi:MAG: serine--tRNA ligase [Planctomycetota bacterium]
MLDLKFVRENVELVRAGARKKRIEVDIDALLRLDEERRKTVSELDGLRTELRTASKRIGSLPPEERAQAASATKELKERVRLLEGRLVELDREIREIALRVPNVPAAEVPEGKDESENVEVRRWGEPAQFGFSPRDHIEIARLLDAVDVDRAARIAGSRTYFLKGVGVLLERAVLSLALDHMLAKGFVPFQVPLLVRDVAMEGTAYYPGGEEQAYRVEKDGLSLVGTAEVPLTSFHLGEILDEKDLPLRYVALSPCFRREAGTYGRDTRGFYRVHQFMKVEQVVVCRADEEESLKHHHEIIANAEELVRALELPYRVVNVCGGDLGVPQVQKFDIECWMPSRNNWGETHSASRFHDFQARRLGLRYRDASGKVRTCHTLNNTVVASPRILIPLLEIHQQEDGSVRVPEVLRPYLGGRALLERVAGEAS